MQIILLKSFLKNTHSDQLNDDTKTLDEPLTIVYYKTFLSNFKKSGLKLYRSVVCKILVQRFTKRKRFNEGFDYNDNFICFNALETNPNSNFTSSGFSQNLVYLIY